MKTYPTITALDVLQAALDDECDTLYYRVTNEDCDNCDGIDQCPLTIMCEALANDDVAQMILSKFEVKDGKFYRPAIASDGADESHTETSSRQTPTHYQLDPEPISVIKAWNLGFCLGNVIKYIARAGRKTGESRESDLHKAMTYLRMELEDE